MSPDQGIPGWFIAIFVLVAVLGVGSTIWRVTTARKIARDAGLDQNAAAAISLLDRDGVGATYVASTLAARSAQQPADAREPAGTTEQRLRELQALKDRGLISGDEYDAQRKNILGSI